MGVDLLLAPVEYVTAEGEWICLNVFTFDLNEIVSPFVQLRRLPVSTPVFWTISAMPADLVDRLPPRPYLGGPWQDAVFGRATETDLRYVLAEDVRAVVAGLDIGLDEINVTERAALAYICALPDAWEVIIATW
jgi:hypothetical protein